MLLERSFPLGRADNLDVTTSAVKAALARARKMLRHRLIRQGFVVSALLGTASLSANKACGAVQVQELIASLATSFQASKSATASSLTAPVDTNLIQLLSQGFSTMQFGIAQTSMTIALSLVGWLA